MLSSPPLPRGPLVTRRVLWSFARRVAESLGMEVECDGVTSARAVGGAGRFLRWQPKGRKGRKGPVGDVGPVGFDGTPAGPSELPGEPGLKGLKGDPGDRPKGDPGDIGEIGDTGIPGQNPEPGDPGPDGFPGVPGANVPGVEGPKGPHYEPTFVDLGPLPPGIKGPPGPPGAPSPADKTALIETAGGIISFSAREGTVPLFRDSYEITLRGRDVSCVQVDARFLAVCEAGSLFVQHVTLRDVPARSAARVRGTRAEVRAALPRGVSTRALVTVAGVRRGCAHWRMPEFSRAHFEHNQRYYARAHQS